MEGWRGSLHIIQVGDLALLVGNDGEGNLGAGDLVDVLDPVTVTADGVGRQADQLDAALGELGLELGKSAELGGADRREVLRVREQDDPFVSNELVEVNWAVGGLGLEVGGDAAQAQPVCEGTSVSFTDLPEASSTPPSILEERR